MDDIVEAEVIETFKKNLLKKIQEDGPKPYQIHLKTGVPENTIKGWISDGITNGPGIILFGMVCMKMGWSIDDMFEMTKPRKSKQQHENKVHIITYNSLKKRNQHSVNQIIDAFHTEEMDVPNEDEQVRIIRKKVAEKGSKQNSSDYSGPDTNDIK